MKQLIQKKLFSKLEFRISDTKLYCNTTKFGGSNEFDIPFEGIDGEKVSLVTTSYLLFVIATCIVLTGIGVIILSILANVEELDVYGIGVFTILTGIATLWYFWYTKESFWKLKLDNGAYIHFHKDLPDEKSTNEFLSELITTRNKYLRKNYVDIDKNLDYEGQLNNFRWLKSINVISEDEFDQKYSELKETVSPNKTRVGYSG